MSGERRRHHQAEFENPDTMPDESGGRAAASTSRRSRHFGLVPMEVASLRGTSPWQRGSRIDRYELVEEIAAGGMSVVWSARDVDLGREVAIKLIRSGGWPREAHRDHLLAEAR